ncbi:hypothetical protein ACOSZE_07025 [Lysinibacillus fusiformis]|uniref:hypothetical protein n=1 Tax=Lysinibacillus fusiformis TaxID=28031 RepID=UPI003BA2BE28
MYFNNGHSCCTYGSDYPPYYYRQCFDLNECPPVWQGYRLVSGTPVANCDNGKCPEAYNPQPQQDYKQNMPRIPEFMYSPYGWKIKEINGKKYWSAMNKKEYQIEAASVLSIHPSDVIVSCGSIGDSGCNGSCPAGRFCARMGGPDSHFCGCIGYRPQDTQGEWF